jgi:hypothetical protein
MWNNMKLIMAVLVRHSLILAVLSSTSAVPALNRNRQSLITENIHRNAPSAIAATSDRKSSPQTPQTPDSPPPLHQHSAEEHFTKHKNGHNPLSKPKPVLFLHIGKAGGGTITEILRYNNLTGNFKQPLLASS